VDTQAPVFDIKGGVVFEIPIESVRFLDEDRPTRRLFSQVREHGVESGTSALAGRFDIDKLFDKDEALTCRIVAQQSHLGLDAVAFFALFLAADAGIQDSFRWSRCIDGR
jgi:hypothetical protein